MRLLFTALACLISFSVLCQNDYSLSFDGQNDFVEISNIGELASFSCCFWTVVDPANSTNNRIIDYDGGNCSGCNDYWSIEVNSNSEIEVRLRNNQLNTMALNSPFSINDGLWHYVSYVRNGTENVLFIDGIIVNQASHEDFLIQHNQNLFFGFTDYSGAPINQFFKGKIDEIGIWNTALSNQEIQNLFLCQSNGVDDSLIGYWDFEEGTGNSVNDISGNGNNGIINGASWSTDTSNQNCIIEGCIDESACNYDSTATIDDGSCEYITPVDLGENIETCAESVTLDAGAGYDSYTWSTGETTQTIEVNESGDYSVEVQNGNSNNFSMSFDGNNDFINSNAEIELEGDFTIQGWWYKSTELENIGAPDDHSIFWCIGDVQTGGLELYVGADETGNDVSTKLYHNSNVLIYAEDQNLGEWHFYSVIRESGELSLFIDGELMSTNSNFDSVISGEINVGQEIYNGTNTYSLYLNGFAHGFEIWDVAISAQQLTESFNCNAISFTEGLVLEWIFNNDYDSQLPDYYGNINGTINGASWSEFVPEQSCVFCESSDVISITFTSSGCTDETACNYDSGATCDDGSCEYITPVDLGDDIETCEESVTLDAGPGYDAYLWSNGETTQTIVVSESGEYSVEVTSFSNNMDEIQGYNLIGTFESNKYFISENSILWEEAREVSESIGGHLVTITSSEENDFVWTAVYNNGLNPGGSNNYQAWIGLYQNLDSPNYNEPDGGWEWVTGEEIIYENWAEGLPNNFADGYYAHITDGGNTDCYSGNILCGVWDDHGYTNNLTTAFYVVEFENLSICSDISNITVNFNASGCTDENACNYNSDAICDDGSCEYITQVELGDDIETCEESVTLDAGSGYDSYLWNTGETTQTINVSETGEYNVELTNFNIGSSNESIFFNNVSEPITFEPFVTEGSDGISFSFHIKNNWENEYEHILDFGENGGLRFVMMQSDNEFRAWIERPFDLNGDGSTVMLDNQDIDGSYLYYLNHNMSEYSNTYCHIAIVFSENIKIYVNGALVQEALITEDGFDDNSFYFGEGGDSVIGNNNPYGDMYGFEGYLDEIAIWNKKLNQSEINDLSNCLIDTSDSNLLSYWNCDQNQNNQLIQSAGSIYIANINLPDNVEFSSQTSSCNFTETSLCSTNDSILIYFNSLGCTDENACNYDEESSCDDGSCLYLDECGECGGTGTLGCTDMSACNYDSEADCDDESCTYPVQHYDCNGNCINDIDGDGVCNELEIPGCTDQYADNYDSSATDDDGTCEYLGCTNPIAENYDSTANVDDGSCIILGCMDADAANYNIDANQDDASCLYDIDYVNDSYDDGYDDGVESVDCPLCPPCDNDCPGDYTGDGSVTVGDLLEFLILFGNQCE